MSTEEIENIQECTWKQDYSVRLRPYVVLHSEAQALNLRNKKKKLIFDWTRTLKIIQVDAEICQNSGLFISIVKTREQTGWLGGGCQLPQNHVSHHTADRQTHKDRYIHPSWLLPWQQGQNNPRGPLPRPLAHSRPFTDRPKHLHTQTAERAGAHTHLSTW